MLYIYSIHTYMYVHMYIIRIYTYIYVYTHTCMYTCLQVAVEDLVFHVLDLLLPGGWPRLANIIMNMIMIISSIMNHCYDLGVGDRALLYESLLRILL